MEKWIALHRTSPLATSARRRGRAIFSGVGADFGFFAQEPHNFRGSIGGSGHVQRLSAQKGIVGVVFPSALQFGRGSGVVVSGDIDLGDFRTAERTGGGLFDLGEQFWCNPPCAIAASARFFRKFQPGLRMARLHGVTALSSTERASSGKSVRRESSRPANLRRLGEGLARFPDPELFFKGCFEHPAWRTRLHLSAQQPGVGVVRRGGDGFVELCLRSVEVGFQFRE